MRRSEDVFEAEGGKFKLGRDGGDQFADLLRSILLQCTLTVSLSQQQRSRKGERVTYAGVTGYGGALVDKDDLAPVKGQELRVAVPSRVVARGGSKEGLVYEVDEGGRSGPATARDDEPWFLLLPGGVSGGGGRGRCG